LRQTNLKVSEILEAEDGQQALDVLSKESVDIVLSDINMPRMNGLQLLSELRQRHDLSRIPVLMITSESGSESVVQAAELGAAG
jgi:two-component system chemotaxis response regulator CheY